MGYELTDDDIDDLRRLIDGYGVTYRRRAIIAWFAALPVVAETEPTEATDEDVGEYFKAHAGEWHRRIDTMPHVDVDMACRRAALTAVHRRMRERERPASSSGPKLQAAPEPRKPVPAHIADASQAYYAEFRADVDRKIRRYIQERGRLARSPQSGLTARTIHCEVATAMMSLYDSLFRRHIDDDLGYGGDVTPVPPTPPPDPEPPPPVADYMTYHPDRIEFRAKGDGQHDPVVAKITAGGLLMAMQAVTEIKRGNAS
jgi:hypothetical protein